MKKFENAKVTKTLLDFESDIAGLKGIYAAAAKVEAIEKVILSPEGVNSEDKIKLVQDFVNEAVALIDLSPELKEFYLKVKQSI